jgi:hypothetical protein
MLKTTNHRKADMGIPKVEQSFMDVLVHTHLVELECDKCGKVVGWNAYGSERYEPVMNRAANAYFKKHGWRRIGSYHVFCREHGLDTAVICAACVSRFKRHKKEKKS